VDDKHPIQRALLCVCVPVSNVFLHTLLGLEFTTPPHSRQHSSISETTLLFASLYSNF